MGTLDNDFVDCMLIAIQNMKANKKPIVFDPVGVGASKYRNEVAAKILKAGPPNVIRGNASEIMALANAANTSKGVDSTESSDSAVGIAQQLSYQLNCTIVVSGATD
mmetsp:Transcript_65085/g.55245  ORF Transcript_65085/g.55245 Transcript_65085/m.55245 type:complete len:107 (+) Transcript_65085:128-448(+)